MLKLISFLLLTISIFAIIVHGTSNFVDNFISLLVYYVAIYAMLLLPAIFVRFIQYLFERRHP